MTAEPKTPVNWRLEALFAASVCMGSIAVIYVCVVFANDHGRGAKLMIGSLIWTSICALFWWLVMRFKQID